MKNIIIGIIVVLALGLGIYYFTGTKSNKVVLDVDKNVATTTKDVVKVATSTVPVSGSQSILGTSVSGKNILAYHYGTGSTEILLVGGIHGGYAWNTPLLAFQVMDYLKANPTVIPAGLRVTVIPVLNPDGLAKVTGTDGRFTVGDVSESQTTVVAGRFNANKVDLNRNFDCDWQSTGVWQNKDVSGGTSAFSEPETKALKTYVEASQPKAVVAWYSAAGGVYSSNCHNGVLPETKDLTSNYAKASGYTANDEFDFYETTGDFTNWLAKKGIPAIGVLLTNHTDTELAKNKAGLLAIFKYYTK